MNPKTLNEFFGSCQARFVQIVSIPIIIIFTIEFIFASKVKKLGQNVTK